MSDIFSWSASLLIGNSTFEGKTSTASPWIIFLTKVIAPFERGHHVEIRNPIALRHLIQIPMSAIYLLIGFSLVVAIGFLGVFLWAVRSGQYEDSYTPSVRMLFDDGTQSPIAPSPETTDSTDPSEPNTR